jgi:hypothetical protein
MVLKKVGEKYKVVSKTTGKSLSKLESKKEALHREKQIQFFKNDEKYKKDHGRGIPMRKKK